MGRPEEAVATLGGRPSPALRRRSAPRGRASRYTALVYESIDPEKAEAAWQGYVIALSRIARPTPRDVTQLGAALSALDELAKRAPAPSTPR